MPGGSTKDGDNTAKRSSADLAGPDRTSKSSRITHSSKVFPKRSCGDILKLWCDIRGFINAGKTDHSNKKIGLLLDILLEMDKIARFVEIHPPGFPGPAEKHAQACWEYLCEVSGCGMAYSDLVWYGMVDVCDGYLAAEASRSSWWHLTFPARDVIVSG